MKQPECCEHTPCGFAGTKCNCAPGLEKHRKPVFTTMIVIQVLAIVPASIALLGAARGRQLVIGNWAHESINGKNGFGDFHLYIGFRGIYTRGSLFGREFWTWTEAKENVPSNKKDNLNSCKGAARSELTTAIIALVTIPPAVGTLLGRVTPQLDSGCQKFGGILAGFLGCFATIYSMGTFNSKCFRNLPTKYTIDGVIVGEGNKHIGPGLYCEIVVAVIAFCTGLTHLIMPTPVEPTPLLDGSDKL